MRKKSLTLLSLILAGLLFCGIGAGVMFNEFSSLKYEGEYIYNSGNIKTTEKQLSIKKILKAENEVKIQIHTPHDSKRNKKIVIDDNMQEGYLKVSSTYDSEFLSPSYCVVPFETEEGVCYDGEVEIAYYEKGNFFDFVLKIKDVMLKDIKNNKIRSYRGYDDVDIVITAGPQTAKRIKFEYHSSIIEMGKRTAECVTDTLRCSYFSYLLKSSSKFL